MSETLDVFVMVAILGGLICGGFFLIWWIRKRLGSPSPDPGMPFSLADLRSMLARGEITQQEYDRARQSMVERVGGPPPIQGTDGVPEQSDGKADVP